MCNAPVGKGQSYWGLIQVSPTDDGELSAAQIKEFKIRLTQFLDGVAQDSGLDLEASLANGTTREDRLSPTSSLVLQNVNG